MNRIPFVLVVAALLCACGASTLKVAPVTVEPIHVTVDVNLHDGNSTPAPKR